jgi:hypothetical protein
MTPPAPRAPPQITSHRVHIIPNISTCLSSGQHDVSSHRLYLLSRQDVLVVVWLTRGFCCTCPVAAIRLIPIGKEIERRSQEGEDISVLDNVGPVRYSPRKTANTRPADAALIQRASLFPKKLLRHESGVSQDAIDRFFRGERNHSRRRKKLAEGVEKLRLRGQ